MSGYERKGPKLVCVRAQCWAGAGAGTNETENSGEKVVAAAGRAALMGAALVPPARMQPRARMLHQYSSNPAPFSSYITLKL